MQNPEFMICWKLHTTSCAALEIAVSYLFNINNPLTCYVLPQREYDVYDNYMSIPTVMKRDNVKTIFKLSTDRRESTCLNHFTQTIT